MEQLGQFSPRSQPQYKSSLLDCCYPELTSLTSHVISPTAIEVLLTSTETKVLVI